MLKSTISLLATLFLFGNIALTQSWTKEQLDSIAHSFEIENGPGFSLGVIQDQKLVYTSSKGMANLEYGIPNDNNSVFRIASMSKQFTAACIIQLHLDKKLNLSDPLSKYFPKLPQWAAKVTIKQLIHHTSGIRDYLELSYFMGIREEDYYTDAQIMSWLEDQQSLNFSPGDKHVYCNSGYWLLSQIVKQITGNSMADYAQETFFAPLKMNSTHFHDNPNAVVKNRASGYSLGDNDQFQINMTPLPNIGDGGIFTTVNDFTLWNNEYFERKILSDQFWELALERAVLNDGTTIQYGAGLDFDEVNGREAFSHGGAFVGFLSHFITFPKEGLTVFTFCNTNEIGPWEIDGAIVDLIYPPLEENAESEKPMSYPRISLPLKELEVYTGVYYIQEGIEIEISLEGENLVALQKWNEETFEIAPFGENSFIDSEFEEIEIIFSDFKSDGNAHLMTINQGTYSSKCRRNDAFDKTSVNLDSFIGTYICSEIAEPYMIKKQNDELYIFVGNASPRKMIPFQPGTFLCEGNFMDFEWENGNLRGFTIGSGRASKIYFSKEQ